MKRGDRKVGAPRPLRNLSHILTRRSSHILVAVGVVASIAIAVAGIQVRERLLPSPAGDSARRFITAWKNADFHRAYAFLDTSLAEDVFVDAVPRSVLIVGDVQIEQVVQQDGRRAVVRYSATVPDAPGAAAIIVLANRLRYSESCSTIGAQLVHQTRIEDTLDVQRNDKGFWKVGLRGASELAHGGARLFGLAYDFDPQFIWGHLSAGLNPTDDRYDDHVIYEALTVYREDLGPDQVSGDLATQTGAVRELVARVVHSCKG